MQSAHTAAPPACGSGALNLQYPHDKSTEQENSRQLPDILPAASGIQQNNTNGRRTMRAYTGMMSRRWWKRAGGGVLILLGLTQIGMPESYGQMSYSGGFVQRHRHSSNPPALPAPPKTTPATPPSYFPDNDFSFSPYGTAGVPDRPPAPPARVPPYGIVAAAFPWNQPGFVDYNEPLLAPRDLSIAEPKKYTLEVTTLPQEAAAGRPDATVLVAHLPEQAAFWVEGTLTRSLGRTRYFQSPPLLPDQKYAYRVRVLWLENGQWVSQTRRVPVEAGSIQAIYLRPSLPAKSAKNASKK